MAVRHISDASRLPRTHWRVLFLLFLSVFINYIDRSNLAIAAPLLKDEFGFSATQLGVLFSAFFWTYACFQLVSGWLVDRFDACWVIACGFFLWSTATAATGLLHGLATFIAMRMLLGIGESVAFPSYSKIISRHFPEARRGVANSLITAGIHFGPAIGMLFGGMLVASIGWRPFFLGLGLLSLLWLVPWLKWKPSSPAQLPASVQRESAGTSQILRQRSAWGTFLGLFSANYINYFLLMWLPYYLVRERHFSMHSMAVIGALIYGCGALCAISSGWLADRWIATGASPTRARKTFTAGGLVVAAVILIACIFAGPGLSVALLILLGSAFGICGSNLWAITQTLAGAHVVGRWVGVQNFLGNLAGVAAPAITGVIVDRTGHFGWALAATAAVALTGAASYVFVVGRVEQINWVSTAARADAATASQSIAA